MKLLERTGNAQPDKTMKKSDKKKIYNNVEFVSIWTDDEFFKMGNSMLLDSGQEIAKFGVIYNGEKAELTIETQGRVKVINTETDYVYYYPSDFPDDLKEGLKSGNVDGKYVIDENNWYEVFICVENESGELYMDNSWVMECEPRDFSDLDDLCQYISEYVTYEFED